MQKKSYKHLIKKIKHLGELIEFNNKAMRGIKKQSYQYFRAIL